MRSMEISLEDRFSKCQTTLDELFVDQPVTESFKSDLQKLHSYYNHHFFNEHTALAKKKELIREYEQLLENIQAVKEGSLTAEDALKNISPITTKRNWNAGMGTILNTCELLFWVTAAMTSYAFCVGLGIPIIFFNPLAGFAITAGTIVLMLGSIIQAQKCVDEYSSLNVTTQQEKLERTTLSFFASKTHRDELNSEYEDLNDEEREIHYSCIA